MGLLDNKKKDKIRNPYTAYAKGLIHGIASFKGCHSSQDSKWCHVAMVALYRVLLIPTRSSVLNCTIFEFICIKS